MARAGIDSVGHEGCCCATAIDFSHVYIYFSPISFIALIITYCSNALLSTDIMRVYPFGLDLGLTPLLLHIWPPISPPGGDYSHSTDALTTSWPRERRFKNRIAMRKPRKC